jgi:hypothetical protein
VCVWHVCRVGGGGSRCVCACLRCGSVSGGTFSDRERARVDKRESAQERERERERERENERMRG